MIRSHVTISLNLMSVSDETYRGGNSYHKKKKHISIKKKEEVPR